MIAINGMDQLGSADESSRTLKCGVEQSTITNTSITLSTPGQNLTLPPVENLTVRRGDEPQFVATS
jgi:hypothetical protein